MITAQEAVNTCSMLESLSIFGYDIFMPVRPMAFRSGTRFHRSANSILQAEERSHIEYLRSERNESITKDELAFLENNRNAIDRLDRIRQNWEY